MSRISGFSHATGVDKDLKALLHRFIIDALEEDRDNLLDGPRVQLSHFVSDKVHDYTRRRQMAISRYEVDRLTEELVDELTGFGPLEVLLRDDSVSEILVNGPHNIFVERHGILHHSELRFMDDNHLLRVIQRILAPMGRRLDESSPMVDARMPDGSRINAVIPPVALDGPCLSVRKFSREMMNSSDLIASGSIDQKIFEFFTLMVNKRCNVLVSGGTGTGKTTMLNMLSQLINERERIVTIEDTAELQLKHSHVVRLETRPPNADGHGDVSARDLVRNALRMRPDRLILGEIRGVEVLDVLTAMNTGHDGSMTTVHANTAADALLRLETLVGFSGLQIQAQTLRQTIQSAVDIVIQLTRLSDGRRCVSEILEVVGLRDDQYVTNTLFRMAPNAQGGFIREAVNMAGDKLRNETLRGSVSQPTLGGGTQTSRPNRYQG
ncbi:MAG TPA: CpaF family protein [Thiopseudomonas sp.]|nr:CpaF family protein [Thiopseudomonas sp.]